jgi:hypothetical protein
LTWFAPEGESYQCDKKTARERFDVLLSCGRDGVTVYGLYVWQVQIHDLSRPLDGLEWSGQPVLSQYVDDEVPVGEWAEKVAA